MLIFLPPSYPFYRLLRPLKGDGRRAFALYRRALCLRLSDLELLWMDFKDFVNRTPWDKLVPFASLTSLGFDGVDGGITDGGGGQGAKGNTVSWKVVTVVTTKYQYRLNRQDETVKCMAPRL